MGQTSGGRHHLQQTTDAKSNSLEDVQRKQNLRDFSTREQKCWSKCRCRDYKNVTFIKYTICIFHIYYQIKLMLYGFTHMP